VAKTIQLYGLLDSKRALDDCLATGGRMERGRSADQFPKRRRVPLFCPQGKKTSNVSKVTLRWSMSVSYLYVSHFSTQIWWISAAAIPMVGITCYPKPPGHTAAASVEPQSDLPEQARAELIMARKFNLAKKAGYICAD
jgi:hypothetical protein